MDNLLQSEQPLTGTLEVDGGSLYYEVIGNGAPVVLIHGGFGDRRMWDDQFHEFARHFKVVRYDHRGFGHSSAPQASYSPVADLLRLLDHLKIERAHLAGNSMGGSLALDFALEHPERAASIVMAASGPGGYPVPQEDMDRAMSVFRVAEEQGLQQAAEHWIANPMVAVASKDPRTQQRLRAMITENRAVFQMKFWPFEPLDPPAFERLAEAKTPTMIVVGDRDMPLLRKMADAAAAGMRGAKQVVIAGADHLPQMVKPEEFNRVVLEFLRGL